MSRGKRCARTTRTPRSSALLWAAGAVAALLLTLGANGTLSGWSTAVIGNDTNSVATGQAVILQETQGANTCRSSATVTNVSTCTTINKYGGTTTPLVPGTNQVSTVTFTNIGSANATTFSLAPGTCTQTPAAGSGTIPATNLCTSGDLTVAVSCSPGATYSSGSAWSDVVYVPAAPPTATKTHNVAAGDLNAGATWTCQFTVALSAAAPVAAQGITVSQPLTWTLARP